MMLAYLELMEILVGLPLWLGSWSMVGGVFLYVGWRYVAKDRQARYWRAVGCYALGEGLFVASLIAVSWLVRGVIGWARFEALAIGIVVGFVPFWIAAMFMLSLPFRKAVLAWLVVLSFDASWFLMLVLLARSR